MITSMLGRPRADPCPIPAPRGVCRIGTSARVVKYMNAPAALANRLAHSELPPNSSSLVRSFISMSADPVSGTPRSSALRLRSGTPC